MRRTLIIIVLLTVFLGLMAQTPARPTVRVYPSKYNEVWNEKDLAPQTAENKNRDNWTVYAAVAGARTYKGPSGTSGAMSTLSFMDYFYVTDEVGDYVHIFKDDKIDFNKLSAGATDCGWARKADLLIWRSALVTRELRVYRKALVVNTVETIANSDVQDLKVLRFRQAPVEDAAFTDYQSRMFEYYYVFKTSVDSNGKTWYLIGATNFITSYRTRTKILGWADKSRLIDWDSRLAVEANWDPGSIHERREVKQRPVVFFTDRASAVDYGRTGKEASDSLRIWDRDTARERSVGDLPRFPVLAPFEKVDSFTMVKAGIVGDVKHNMETVFTAEKYAAIKQQMTDKLREKKTVNVVFVIDATQSMRPYSRAVRNAIQKTIETLKSTNSTNKFNFAVTVYRDHTEPKPTETLDFSSNPREIMHFLENVQESHDTTVYEDVYDGVLEALYSSQPDKDATNFMVVIGDAGNHLGEFANKEDEIAKLLKEDEFNLLVFQVHNNGGTKEREAYGEFVKQFHRIGQKFGRLCRFSLEGMDNGDFLPEVVNDGSNYRFKTGSSYHVFNLYGLPAGSVLTAEDLQKEMTKQLASYDAYANEFVDYTTDKFYQRKQKMADKSWGTFAPGYYYLLRQAGVSDNDIRSLEKENYQMFVEGWGVKSQDGNQYPYLRNVLLFSENELNYVILRIQDVYRYPDVEQLINYLHQQAEKLLVISDSNPDLTLNDLLSQILGLKIQSDLFSDKYIKNWSDLDKLTQEDYLQLKKLLGDKMDDLQYLINAPESKKYTFTPDVNAGGTYYWVEEERIP
jgi:hypothetical protein